MADCVIMRYTWDNNRTPKIGGLKGEMVRHRKKKNQKERGCKKMINTNKGNVTAPLIQGRIGVQTGRIIGGDLSGRLTTEELNQLKTSNANFLNNIATAKGDDGFLSLTERLELHKELNGMSREIYKLKHNDDIDGINATA